MLRAIRAGRCRERRYADHIYSDILQNAQLRSQIFKIFFASGGKGALTPNQNPADVHYRSGRIKLAKAVSRTSTVASTVNLVRPTTLAGLSQ